MNCKKCGTYLRPEDSVCPCCGTHASESVGQSVQAQSWNHSTPASQQFNFISCRFCGEKNGADHQFCSRCGKPLVASAMNMQSPKPPKKEKKTWIYFAIAVAAVFMIAIIFLFTRLSRPSSPSLQEQTVPHTTAADATSEPEATLPSESAAASEPAQATTAPTETQATASTTEATSTAAPTTAPTPVTDPPAVLTNAAAKEIYRNYFWANYPDAKYAGLVDVTQDRIDEMFVVTSYIDDTFEGNYVSHISAYIFTIDNAQQVKQIYRCDGVSDHWAGQLFNLGIISGVSAWYLGHEEGMWFTGVGDLTYRVFWLNPDGTINLVDEFGISSGTIVKEVEATGKNYDELLDAYWNEYEAKKAKYLSGGVEIDSFNINSITDSRIPMDPKKVFG